ncbi:MAG: hypothetical protein EOM34_07295 [Clostridia bacterium]|nr:hypothetical protein [Lachnospiraceae bacterium]NCC00473.1 hypothetical protein [Clostridia bacterium]NCD02484.1 hypothetical protein [Clostridia bacterium]
MSTVSIVLIVILVVILIALGVLAFWGNKQQKKAESAQQQIDAAAQPMTMLVIDKKRLKMTESGLPKIVIDSTPKLMRRTKVPIVKAKVGPRIMTLIADDKIYDLIPVKQEVKAMVSGMYIVSVKSLRGPALTAPPKVGFFQRMKNKISGK